MALRADQVLTVQSNNNMPTIPLFDQGQTVKTPQVQAPPQGRRLQVVMDLNGAAKGFATPLIPEALADRSGGIAIGAAGHQIGNAMMQLGRKKAEAQNITHVGEADMEMQKEMADFENWKLKNPDENTWQPEWNQRMTSLPERLFSDSQSSDARRVIDQRFKLFQGQSSIRLSTDAAKQAFNKAGETLTANAVRAFDGGDLAGGRSYIEQGVRSGFIAGDTAARMVISAEHQDKARRLDDLQASVSAALDNRQTDAAKKLVHDSGDLLTGPQKEAKLAEIGARHESNIQADEVQALSLTKPAEAVRKLEAGEWDKIRSPGDRQMLIAKAKDIQAGYASEAFRDIKTRIDLDQVKPEETFEGPGMDDLTPLQRDILKAYNANKTKLGAMNNTARFQQVDTAIEAYKPEPGDSLQRANFEALLEANFSGPHLDVLKKKWSDKLKAQPEIVDTAEAFQALDKWAFNDQRLGKFKDAMTENGKPVMKKKEGLYQWDSTAGLDFWGLRDTGEYVKGEDTYEPVTQENPTARDRVAAQVANIKETLRREKADGKLTDSASVFKRMAELAKMPLAASAASETSAAPNPLLPPLDGAEKVDLTKKALEILKR